MSELLEDTQIACDFPLKNKDKSKGTLQVHLQWKPFVDSGPHASVPSNGHFSSAVLFVHVVGCENLVSSSESRVRVSVGSQKEYTPYVAGSSPTYQHSCYFFVRDVQAQRLRVEVEGHTGIALLSIATKALGSHELQLADVGRQVTGFQDRYPLSDVRNGTIDLAVLLRFVKPDTC